MLAMPPSHRPESRLDPGDLKVIQVADSGACNFLFYGANHRTSMLVSSPLMKHINTCEVRSLIEARWTEHWMEDRMLGLGHNKGAGHDGEQEGLLRQQLHRATLEAKLLEMALNSKFPDASDSVHSTPETNSTDLSQPMANLDINKRT